jgi:curved DNA-binding protein CbpA
MRLNFILATAHTHFFNTQTLYRYILLTPHQFSTLLQLQVGPYRIRMPEFTDSATPYHLMPIAAVLVSLGLLSLAALVYSTCFRQNNKNNNAPLDNNKNRTRFAITFCLCFIGYSYCLGRIDGSLLKQAHAQFDAHKLLGVTVEANTTAIAQAYRELAKVYHPSSKQANNETVFQQITWAYQALTDDTAKLNYQRHGHPQGPLLTPVLAMPRAPMWLFVWEASMRAYMIAAYALVGIVSFILFTSRSKPPLDDQGDNDDDDDDLTFEQNQVMDSDLQWYVDRLTPDLKHRDILLLALSTPSIVAWCTKDLRNIEKQRAQRLLVEPCKTKTDFELLLEDDQGWAEEEEDDDAAKKANEEKKKEQELLNRAMKKTTQLFEGLDEGVLGQQWVQETLATAKKWPPTDLGILANESFAYQGKEVAAREHPAVLRMTCMLTGRLNSVLLNTHPDLIKAGAAQRIDQTYFGASMQFRQRMSLLLEAILRLASTLKSSRLLTTALEAVAMFKIGCEHGQELWFKDAVQRQYGCQPEMSFADASITTEGENEMVAGDCSMLKFNVTRLHAENFLREKIESFQRQGIPPQVGLAQFREVWWFFLTCERLDGPTPSKTVDRSDPLFQQLSFPDDKIARFDEQDGMHYMLANLPVMYGNAAQKQIQIQARFRMPEVPGKYRFRVCLKGLDFLGADQSFDVEANVISPVDAGREPTKEPDSDEEEADVIADEQVEGKKDK